MKLDKETFVKHQFWFLLGGYLFFWLIAVLWLWSTASGKIAEVKKAYEDNSAALKKEQTNPINTGTFLPPWEREATIINGHKSVIWDGAWKIQEGMYDWPKEWSHKDMTNPQTPLSPDELNRYRYNLYPDQIENLRKNAPLWLKPVELEGGFDNVFEPKKDWKEAPTREECWLAQEDFWVKRELLLIVWDTMAKQAMMYPQPIDDKKEPKPEGVEARHRYRNQNWEITLYIRKNKNGQSVIGGDSTIKNVQPTRRPQPLTSAKGEGILFNVAQAPVQTRFEVRGEPVAPDETRSFSQRDKDREDYDPLDGIVWERAKERPIIVSQGFDYTNSPIRRINAISLTKQDCRTYTWPLQANQALAQLDAIPEDPNAKPADASASSTSMAGAGSTGGPPGGMPGGGSSVAMMPMGPGGMPGMAGGYAPPVNLTQHNEIDRNRYLQPTSQDKTVNPPSRHLPLALQLIVEQSHMQDVLVALANARLRFQITQAEFRRVKDYVPQSEGDKKDGTEMMGRGFMGPGPGMYGNSMQMQMQMQMRMRKDPGGSMAPVARMPGMPGMPSMPGGSGAGPMRGGSMAMMGSMMGGPPPMMRPPFPGGPGGMNRMGPSTALPPTMRRGDGFSPPAGANGTATAAANKPDDNLLEVTIYGIATLYRHPDVAKTTDQPSTPGQPAPQPNAQPSGAAPPPSSQTPLQPVGQQPDKDKDKNKAAPPTSSDAAKDKAAPPSPPSDAGKEKAAPLPPPSEKR